MVRNQLISNLCIFDQDDPVQYTYVKLVEKILTGQ
jgi:hypothetical protein